jgi:hypothetical protein
MSWFAKATGIDINLTGHKAKKKKKAAPQAASQAAPVSTIAGNTMAQPAVNVTGIMSQENLNTVTGNQGNIQTGVNDANRSLGVLETGQQGLATGQQGLASGQQGIAANVGSMNNGNPTGLYGQFENQNTMLEDRFGTITDQFGNVTTQFGNVANQIDAQTQNMDTRFNTVDTNVGNVQSAVDTGFADQSQRFDTLDTSVGGVQSAVDTGFTNVGDAFTQQNTDLGTAFDTVGEGQTTLQSNILAGQQPIESSLNDLTGNVDAYSSELLANQGIMQGNQDTLQNSFDSYVDRYGEDTELANQARADLQTGLVNTTDLVRQDLGRIAQNNANNQQTLETRLDTTNRNIADTGANALAAMNTGFTDQAGLMNENQQTVTDTMSGVRDNLMTLSGSMSRKDRDRALQFAGLAKSFDAQGQLIQNEIMGNGNTVNRAMDNRTGMMQETVYSPQGQVVGQNNYDVMGLVNEANALTAAQQEQPFGATSTSSAQSPFANA